MRKIKIKTKSSYMLQKTWLIINQLCGKKEDNKGYILCHDK